MHITYYMQEQLQHREDLADIGYSPAAGAAAMREVIERLSQTTTPLAIIQRDAIGADNHLCSARNILRAIAASPYEVGVFEKLNSAIAHVDDALRALDPSISFGSGCSSDWSFAMNLSQSRQLLKQAELALHRFCSDTHTDPHDPHHSDDPFGHYSPRHHHDYHARMLPSRKAARLFGMIVGNVTEARYHLLGIVANHEMQTAHPEVAGNAADTDSANSGF